jgi:hypothetical protein
MISQIENIISSISEREEKLSVLEQLEQENSGNVTERHLLKSEKEYEDSGSISQYGISISSGIILNSAITFGILTMVKNVTLSFNPFSFFLLSGGINVIVSVLSSDNSKAPLANIALGAAKFSVNMGVNGALINSVTQKINESKAIVETINSEIDNYESGYKDTGIDWVMVSVPALILLLLFLLPKFFKGKG